MLVDVPLTELTSDELHARNAWAQVYLIRAHEGDSAGAPPESASREHRTYLRRLEAAGQLYAHGPVEVVAGNSVRELAIIAAASTDDANRIAAGDPLHREGYRTNVVHDHIINEGVACYVAREMSKRAIAAGENSVAVEDMQPETEGHAEAGSGVELFVISLEPTDKPRSDDAEDADHAHFVWLRENEMAARLMSCGPVGPAEPIGPGIWTGGLGVVATSREEAERVAENEPSGRLGYRSLAVRGWTIRDGIAAPIAQALHALNALPTSTG